MYKSETFLLDQSLGYKQLLVAHFRFLSIILIGCSGQASATSQLSKCFRLVSVRFCFLTAWMLGPSPLPLYFSLSSKKKIHQIKMTYNLWIKGWSQTVAKADKVSLAPP